MFAQCIGNVVLFIHVRTVARKLAKEQIEQTNPDMLTRLVIPAKLIRWIHEKEFVYRGQMYDVVTKQIQNDTFTILAFRDDQETYAHEVILKNMQTTTPLAAQRCNAEHILDVLEMLPAVLNPDTSESSLTLHNVSSTQYFINLHAIVVGSPDTPPPREILRLS